MKLNVRDAAQLLGVTDKVIYRWIKDGLIPAQEVDDQYRFNRAELLEWATSRKMEVSPEIFSDGDRGGASSGLADALEAGGIHHQVAGTDKPSVLRAVIDAIQLPKAIDREFLYQVLLAREALGSTGIGQGIAIPHVRHPIVLHLPRPMVVLCFLEHPIDFGAADRQPVSILFTLISPTVKTHLQLLSLLGYALSDPGFQHAILRKAPGPEILLALRKMENTAIAPTADLNQERSPNISD